jgi:hypothetical protein
MSDIDQHNEYLQAREVTGTCSHDAGWLNKQGYYKGNKKERSKLGKRKKRNSTQICETVAMRVQIIWRSSVNLKELNLA